MTLDLSWITLVVLGTPILLFVMFLPTVLELKRPKDAGPRLIMGDVGGANLVLSIPFIVNMEEKFECDAPFFPSLGSILGFLPELDA